MAAPVWVLSVDLQTKTATFQTGMSEAARAAKESFQGIKQDADVMAEGVGEAGGKTTYSMMEARHGVMMLGEEFGVHLPRGLTTFIASLGPVGAAMEAAFPFLAIILGATLLIERLTKLHEESEKLANAQTNMGETVQSVFNKLDDKLLEVGIKTDELNGNHLAALRKQLELIDHEEFKSLIEEFNTLDKVSMTVLNQLKAHWYELGGGSTGAVHALDEFKAKYEGLLLAGKSKEAGDLLAGTLASAEKVLALQKQAIDNQGHSGGQHGNYQQYEQAVIQLKQMGVGITEKEVQAQQTLTDVLRDQSTVAEKLAAIGSGEKKNDTTAEAQRAEAAQEKLAEAQQRGLDHRFQIEANYTKKVAEEHKKQAEEAIKEADLQFEATEAITKAIVDAEKERARITEELGKEEASNVTKMAEEQYNATEHEIQREIAAHKLKGQQIVVEETANADRLYAAQMKGYQEELATLDKYGKDYEVHLKQIQDKEEQLTRAHEEKLKRIKEDAEQETNARILSAEKKMSDEMVNNMMKVLQGHESAGKALLGIGQQVASGLLENAIKSVMANDFTKESDAAAAARKAYLAGESMGGPLGVVLGPTFAAAAFASVMAFEQGGIVPGVEQGDVVPTRTTPGEAILPKGLTEMLTNAAKFGNNGDNREMHVHQHEHNWNINAFDSDGMDRVLTKHSDVIEKHVENQFRKKGM
jgi:hypothetical protein